ncbi:transgelin-2-like [Argopecten irradians]|uniref:transgelin-2-like n=1 Tax=Argopecten irradians TaxID=31199 RepID=UPI003714C069
MFFISRALPLMMAIIVSTETGAADQSEAKMEEQYDKLEAKGIPKHIMVWMNGTMEIDENGAYTPSEKSFDWKTLCSLLKDGHVLCRFINILLEAAEKETVKCQKNPTSMFAIMTNIESFNKGCEQYGLDRKYFLRSEDLWELRKGSFCNVINCLHNLGLLANSRSFIPKYTGEVTN